MELFSKLLKTKLSTFIHQFRVAFTIFVLLSLSSCVYHPRFPEGWGQKSTINNCSDIDGIYKNKGIVGDSGNQKTELVYALRILSHEERKGINFNKLKLRADTNNFNVELIDRDTVVKTANISSNTKNKYSCKNGQISITLNEDMKGAIGVSSEKILLHRRNEDLAIAYNFHGAGLIYGFIPTALSGTTWFLFEKAL